MCSLASEQVQNKCDALLSGPTAGLLFVHLDNENAIPYVVHRRNVAIGCHGLQSSLARRQSMLAVVTLCLPLLLILHVQHQAARSDLIYFAGACQQYARGCECIRAALAPHRA